MLISPEDYNPSPGALALVEAAGDTDAKTVALVALALNALTRRCRNRAAREHLVIAMRAGLTAARVLERQERVMAREVAHA